jgi:hypothetical protein
VDVNTHQDMGWNVHQAVWFMCQMIGYAATFFLALVQTKAVLAARLLVDETQLAVCKLSKCLESWQSCAKSLGARPAEGEMFWADDVYGQWGEMIGPRQILGPGSHGVGQTVHPMRGDC